jgi:hypothetical protein
MNTLAAMFANTEVLPRKRPIELSDASTRASFPILFVLARMAAILLIASLVIACLIVAFGVAELKALWPRPRISHLE